MQASLQLAALAADSDTSGSDSSPEARMPHARVSASEQPSRLRTVLQNRHLVLQSSQDPKKPMHVPCNPTEVRALAPDVAVEARASALLLLNRISGSGNAPANTVGPLPVALTEDDVSMEDVDTPVATTTSSAPPASLAPDTACNPANGREMVHASSSKIQSNTATGSGIAVREVEPSTPVGLRAASAPLAGVFACLDLVAIELSYNVLYEMQPANRLSTIADAFNYDKSCVTGSAATRSGCADAEPSPDTSWNALEPSEVPPSQLPRAPRASDSSISTRSHPTTVRASAPQTVATGVLPERDAGTSNTEDSQPESSTVELKEYLQRTLHKVATGPSTMQIAKRLEPAPATEYVEAAEELHSRELHQPSRLQWRSSNRSAGVYFRYVHLPALNRRGFVSFSVETGLLPVNSEPGCLHAVFVYAWICVVLEVQCVSYVASSNRSAGMY